MDSPQRKTFDVWAANRERIDAKRFEATGPADAAEMWADYWEPSEIDRASDDFPFFVYVATAGDETTRPGVYTLRVEKTYSATKAHEAVCPCGEVELCKCGKTPCAEPECYACYVKRRRAEEQVSP